jgi:hypothetical protein
LRAGTLNPGRKAQASLTKLAGDFAREQVRAAGVVPPADPIDCCVAYLETIAY